LYSGEQFDSKIGQQYLRARYYDPATGRFNRLDPFFGNLNDPLSLHKYLYVHNDPINGVDPSGKFYLPIFLLLGGTLLGLGVGATMVDGPFDALRAGIIGGIFIPIPLIGLGYLGGIYLSPWNWKTNSDYKNIWTLLDDAIVKYKSGDYIPTSYKKPTEVFYDFRNGDGEYNPRRYYFGNCPMTRALSQHSQIILEKEFIKQSLHNHDIPQESNQKWFTAPYYLIPYDLLIFAGDMISDWYTPYTAYSNSWEVRLLESFLGTFTYGWEIAKDANGNPQIDWNTKEARVYFRAGNASGWRSATRIPNPISNNTSILGEQNTGYFATTTQFFYWEETINFE
jgi:RHS repeat-associated protein